MFKLKYNKITNRFPKVHIMQKYVLAKDEQIVTYNLSSITSREPKNMVTKSVTLGNKQIPLYKEIPKKTLLNQLRLEFNEVAFGGTVIINGLVLDGATMLKDDVSPTIDKIDTFDNIKQLLKEYHIDIESQDLPTNDCPSKNASYKLKLWKTSAGDSIYYSGDNAYIYHADYFSTSRQPIIRKLTGTLDDEEDHKKEFSLKTHVNNNIGKYTLMFYHVLHISALFIL